MGILTGSLSATATVIAVLAPEYTLLSLQTVLDIWREWKEGIGGRPAVEQLEKRWAHAWRSSTQARTAFCHQKRIIDEVQALINAGSSLDDAVTVWEQWRGLWSLNKLSEMIVQWRKAGGQGDEGWEAVKAGNRSLSLSAIAAVRPTGIQAS